MTKPDLRLVALNVKALSDTDSPTGEPPGGGDGGNMDGMEARVIKLEEFAQETRERLTRIETRLDQTATKADLSEAMNGMVKWVVGTGVALGVAGITIMTFVLNNATPKPPAGSTPPPIIINVPAAAAPAETAPQASPTK